MIMKYKELEEYLYNIMPPHEYPDGPEDILKDLEKFTISDDTPVVVNIEYEKPIEGSVIDYGDYTAHYVHGFRAGWVEEVITFEEKIDPVRFPYDKKVERIILIIYLDE